jgi:hypothetical protein
MRASEARERRVEGVGSMVYFGMWHPLGAGQLPPSDLRHVSSPADLVLALDPTLLVERALPEERDPRVPLPIGEGTRTRRLGGPGIRTDEVGRNLGTKLLRCSGEIVRDGQGRRST